MLNMLFFFFFRNKFIFLNHFIYILNIYNYIRYYFEFIIDLDLFKNC